MKGMEGMSSIEVVEVSAEELAEMVGPMWHIAMATKLRRKWGNRWYAEEVAASWYERKPLKPGRNRWAYEVVVPEPRRVVGVFWIDAEGHYATNSSGKRGCFPLTLGDKSFTFSTTFECRP